MNMFFEQHEFLECFDEERISFFDEDKYIEVYNYSLNTGNNLMFSLFMIPIEHSLSIDLKDINSPIALIKLDFSEHNIDRISLAKESNRTYLNLYKKENSGPFHDRTTQLPFLRIMIKPCVSICIDF